MKLFTADEIRRFEKHSFDVLGLSPRVAMESAGRAIGEFISQEFGALGEQLKITILCGKGNNGGDGYVAARMLADLGHDTTCISFGEPATDESKNAFLAYKEGRNAKAICLCNNIDGVEALVRESSIVVDAVFGTGFRGELDKSVATLFAVINSAATNKAIIAADLPSGVDASTGHTAENSLRATHTVSFQWGKLGTLLEPGASQCGEISIADIGLLSNVGNESSVELFDRFYVGPLAERFLRDRPDMHKGERGHVFIVGGADGTAGAPILSARGAFSLGAGLVSALVGSKAAHGVLSEMPEVMVVEGSSDESIEKYLGKVASGRTSLVVGPGMGTDDRSVRALERVLAVSCEKNVPVVLDADGLNIWSKHRFKLPEQTVVTPHPGEAARLLGSSIAEVEANRIAAATELRQLTQAVVILKGAHSIVCGQVLGILPWASATLATAGSGDVLAGMIGGALARSGRAFDSAVLGAYLHGAAGQLLENEPAVVTASSIPNRAKEALAETVSAASLTRMPIEPLKALI